MITFGSSGSIQPAWQSRQTNESAIHWVSCQTSGWISSLLRVWARSQPHNTFADPHAGHAAGPPITTAFVGTDISWPATSESARSACSRLTTGRPRGGAVPTSFPASADTPPPYPWLSTGNQARQLCATASRGCGGRVYITQAASSSPHPYCGGASPRLSRMGGTGASPARMTARSFSRTRHSSPKSNTYASVCPGSSPS